MSEEDLNSESSASPESVDTEATDNYQYTEVDFRDFLEDSYKNDSALQDIHDINGLAKGYISAQRMLGNSIRIPTEDASTEARKAFYEKLQQIPDVVRMPDIEDKESIDQFYQKLGRPERPDGYKNNVDIGVEIQPEQFSAFAEIAYELGLNQKQFDGLAQYEQSRNTAYRDYLVEQKEQARQQLMSAWGEDYNNRMQGACATLEKYAEKFPDAARQLTQSLESNNPVLIMALSELAESMREKGTISPVGAPKYGITPEEAQAQIDDILGNTEHVIYQESHPGRPAAVKKLERLYEIVGSGRG